MMSKQTSSWVPTALLAVAVVLYVGALVWISQGVFDPSEEGAPLRLPVRHGAVVSGEAEGGER